MNLRIRWLQFLTASLLALAPLTFVHSAPFIVSDESRITEIDKITILPIVTVAEFPPGDKDKMMNLVRNKLALALALKGYVLRREKTFSPTRELTPVEIAGMGPDELVTLGPENATHIMIFFVNALEDSFIIIADSSDASLAAILIDKSTGEILWKNDTDRGFTSSWFNIGFIGMALIDEDEMAIYNAFQALFKTFPERPM